MIDIEELKIKYNGLPVFTIKELLRFRNKYIIIFKIDSDFFIVGKIEILVKDDDDEMNSAMIIYDDNHNPTGVLTLYDIQSISEISYLDYVKLIHLYNKQDKEVLKEN